MDIDTVNGGYVAMGYDYECDNDIKCSRTFKSLSNEKSKPISDDLLNLLD